MFTTGGRRGACARFFLTRSADRFSPSSPYLCLARFPSLAPPRSPSLPLASSRQPDRNQSCRTFIRSGRCEMCFDVPAPVLPRVLLHSRARIFFRVGRIDVGTSIHRPAAWCDQRLMSSRQSRARVCHFDSIRHGTARQSAHLPLSQCSLPSPFYIYIPYVWYISPSLV